MLLTKPSFYALSITGILILAILVTIALNFRQLCTRSPECLIKMISLVGLLIGIHGLLHLGLEVAYNYNPMDQMELMIK